MVERWADEHAETRALVQLDANELDTVDGFLAALLARPAWHAHAACRDADHALFFPGRGESLDPAKAICAQCSVWESCERYALEYDGPLHGVWAGLSAGARRRLTVTAA